MHRIFKVTIAGALLMLVSTLLLVCWKQQCDLVKESGAPSPVALAAFKENPDAIPVVIIGSGCAGYCAAIYSGRARFRTVVLAGNQPGGQLNTTSQVENWPGLILELGPVIMEKLKKQAEHCGAEVQYEVVTAIDTSKRPFRIECQSGTVLHAWTIIMATGSTPAKLGIEGEESYWGRGVTTCAICDAPFYKDKAVVVIGGGDSAAEEALQLSAYAKSITVLVRKDQMRASAPMQERLREVPHIKVLYNHEVTRIEGDDKHVTHVQLFNNKTNEKTLMPINGVFLAIGHLPNSHLLKGSVALDEQGYIKAEGRSQRTSVPGIFVAGDVEDHVYRQAGVAAGSGIKAALDALNYLQSIGYTQQIAQEALLKVEQNAPQKRAISLAKIASEKEFDLLLKNSAVLIVDFYTQYCPSCLQMMPAVEAAAQELQERAVVVKADAGELMGLADRFAISSVPAILVFKDGKLVDRKNQVLTKEQFIELAERYIE
jgi:thioredoxin reductase (NADPH)